MDRIVFKDELFDAQLLRALNHVDYGGADVGECITSAHRIHEGSGELCEDGNRSLFHQRAFDWLDKTLQAS